MDDLMRGLTVLSYRYMSEFNTKLFWTIIAASVIGIILSVIIAIVTNIEEFFFITALFIVTLVYSPVIAYCFPTSYIDECIYKVTIDDSVSMTEFYDRYEILSQEGLIFEIKER